jgi:hypothetical protein
MEGRPSSGATVEVLNGDGDVVDQVAVQDGGGFTYYLSAGTWHFRAYDARGHRGSHDVDLVDGEDAVNIILDLQ